MYLAPRYSLMKFSGENTAVRIPLYDNEQAFTVSCPLHGGRRTHFITAVVQVVPRPPHTRTAAAVRLPSACRASDLPPAGGSHCCMTEAGAVWQRMKKHLEKCGQEVKNGHNTLFVIIYFAPLAIFYYFCIIYL